MDEKSKEEIELIKVKIIDEGRKLGKQLSIRFPKKITEALEIDPKKDRFLFKFDKKNLHLEGELIEEGIAYNVDVMWKNEAINAWLQYEVTPNTPNHK